jgi:hypothetical protein
MRERWSLIQVAIRDGRGSFSQFVTCLLQARAVELDYWRVSRWNRKGMLMKKAINELPTRLEAGGVCFQGQDWGDTNVARVRFPAGADATPLLEGLPNNLCQCPHWGTVLKGSIHVTYADGTEETVNAGDVYYWPPGHTVRVDEDYEAIEFSPSDQMGELMSHLEAKLKG